MAFAECHQRRPRPPHQLHHRSPLRNHPSYGGSSRFGRYRLDDPAGTPTASRNIPESRPAAKHACASASARASGGRARAAGCCPSTRAPSWFSGTARSLGPMPLPAVIGRRAHRMSPDEHGNAAGWEIQHPSARPREWTRRRTPQRFEHVISSTLDHRRQSRRSWCSSGAGQPRQPEGRSGLPPNDRALYLRVEVHRIGAVTGWLSATHPFLLQRGIRRHQMPMTRRFDTALGRWSAGMNLGSRCNRLTNPARSLQRGRRRGRRFRWLEQIGMPRGAVHPLAKTGYPR